MSRNANIHAALVQSVLDCNVGIPLGWEDRAFDDKPTDGSPWGSVYIVPSGNGVRAATMGSTGEDEHLGIVQIDLNFKPRTGAAAMLEKADEVADFFTAGRKLIYGIAKVTILSCSRSRIREVEGYSRTSLTINWSARVPRFGA